MAFICDECHTERGGCDHWMCGLGGSYGPCELCGVTKGCRDCHGTFKKPMQPSKLERLENAMEQLRAAE